MSTSPETRGSTIAIVPVPVRRLRRIPRPRESSKPALFAACTLLALSLLGYPGFLPAQAQTAKVYKVGFLMGAPRADVIAAFEEGLRDRGWINGQNILLERRSAEGNLDRLPALAADLVALKVDLIVATAAPETAAAKLATSTIPIVFVAHGDPVGTGAVQSLPRPGANVTGLSQMHSELSAKQLQLLKQLAPHASRIAVLWNAANPAKARDWRELRPAGGSLKLVLESHEVRRSDDLDAALAVMTKNRPDGLLILSDPLMVSLRTPLAEFAARQRIPAMYQLSVFVEAGGLISYGADLIDLFRRAGGYVDKVLKGAKPADLPIEQARKFEMVINLKTARALNITIPRLLLLQADRVIE